MADEQKFTQADLDAAVTAAVTEAVAPLQARLGEVESAEADSAIAARIAEAVEPLNTQVAALQAQVDEAEVARQAEKDRADGLVAWLDAEAAKATEAAEIAARTESRATQAKEVAGLTDDYLAKTPEGGTVTNLERFAAMSDEAWEATVEGWKVQREAAGAETATGGPPRTTALLASAPGPGRTSALAEASEARLSRVADLRPLSTKR